MKISVKIVYKKVVAMTKYQIKNKDKKLFGRKAVTSANQIYDLYLEAI